MIFSPISELNKIKEKKVPLNIIYHIFALTMLITLAKLPFLKWDQSISIISINNLNDIMTLILHPYIRFIIKYLSYFIGIVLIVTLCKFLTKKDCDDLPLLIISISGMGIAVQVLYLPLYLIFSKDVLLYLTIFLGVWNLTLIMFAVKISSSLSYIKSISIVLMIVIINSIFTFGIGSNMAPYFLFLY